MQRRVSDLRGGEETSGPKHGPSGVLLRSLELLGLQELAGACGAGTYKDKGTP